MSEEAAEEFYRKAAENFLDIFITPEVIKRQDAGKLEKPLDLRAAQIIFYSDERTPEIRINSEVRVLGKIKHKGGITKNPGDPVYENELEGLEGLYLSPDDDPNAGHATLLKINGRWFFAFDFIYNKGLAGKHVEVAKQFLALAETALGETYLVAFIDNLFSASELLAKTQLLTLWPNPQLQKKSSHKAIHTRYNRFAYLGNIEDDHVRTFNKLSGIRSRARYLKGEITLTDAECYEMLEVVQQMLKESETIINVATEREIRTHLPIEDMVIVSRPSGGGDFLSPPPLNKL